jgi:acyl-coenzyme A synthetase/AMP-(fatty) acid ligase
MVQLSTSTFDAHVLEILAPLICGATIIMLHPDGNMDFAYFDHILQYKQVTHLQVVPTFFNHLCDFLKQKMFYPWMTMQNLCCVGEYNQIKQKKRKQIKTDMFL